MNDRPAANPAEFRAYVFGMAGWFAGIGLQMVLFPYLVTIELGKPASLVGVAQMTITAPALFFILLGGAVADRNDARDLLLRYHLMAAVPPVVLAAVLMAGALTYSWIIAFGLVMGTFSAFVLPARDSLLTRVVPRNRTLQHSVSYTVIAQFGGQLLGMLAAGLAVFVGPAPLLLVQAGVIAAGGPTARAIRPQAPHGGRDFERTLEAQWRQIREGIVECVRAPGIAPVLAAMAAVGFIYVGSFMTVFPILIRDVYAGGAGTFALVNVAFWMGPIVSTLILLRVGHIERRGRLLVGALTAGAVILFCMRFDAPLWVTCMLGFLWGTGAGVTMNMGRTIVQEAATPSHRARVLAAYQLAFSGAVPFGALVMGFIVEAFGPRGATIFPSAAMLMFLAVLATRTRILSLRAHSEPRAA